jgi:hypothetical protein
LGEPFFGTAAGSQLADFLISHSERVALHYFYFHAPGVLLFFIIFSPALLRAI